MGLFFFIRQFLLLTNHYLSLALCREFNDILFCFVFLILFYFNMPKTGPVTAETFLAPQGTIWGQQGDMMVLSHSIIISIV